MQVNGMARFGLAVMAVGILLTVGCRSTATDRMRVLEAEKADAERRNSELTHEKAAWRAKQIELESLAKSERARADALNEQVDLMRKTLATSEREVPGETIDRDDLARRFAGTGVKLAERADGPAIVLASDVTFRSGQADLSKKAEETLRKVARALKQTDGIRKVRVEGHTDSDPIKKSGWKSNEELSLARAEVVRLFLVTQGVTEDLLSVVGHGAAKPVESNDTMEHKARNRRVEIVLLTRD